MLSVLSFEGQQFIEYPNSNSGDVSNTTWMSQSQS